MNNQTVTVKKSKITPNYTINNLLHIAAFFFLYCLLWNAHTAKLPSADNRGIWTPQMSVVICNRQLKV